MILRHLLCLGCPGEWGEPLGVAFEGVEAAGNAFAPALSLCADCNQVVSVNFGDAAFAFAPPSGFAPISDFLAGELPVLLGAAEGAVSSAKAHLDSPSSVARPTAAGVGTRDRPTRWVVRACSGADHVVLPDHGHGLSLKATCGLVSAVAEIHEAADWEPLRFRIPTPRTASTPDAGAGHNVRTVPAGKWYFELTVLSLPVAADDGAEAAQGALRVGWARGPLVAGVEWSRGTGIGDPGAGNGASVALCAGACPAAGKQKKEEGAHYAWLCTMGGNGEEVCLL